MGVQTDERMNRPEGCTRHTVLRWRTYLWNYFKIRWLVAKIWPGHEYADKCAEICKQMGVQPDRRTNRPKSWTPYSCEKYNCEIILKSHGKLQRYGQDTIEYMLVNGKKFANEWTYRHINGQTDMNFACHTSSCNYFKIRWLVAKYDQDTNLLTDGWTDGWSDGQTMETIT
jgi:hypothetical protein